MNVRYTLSLLLVALAATACAQRPAWRDRAPEWREADRDGDDQVSQAEYLGRRQAMFRKMDRNADGFLAQDDLGRFARRNAERQGRLAGTLRQADANGDLRVSWSEFEAASRQSFQQWDRDANGLLSPQELPAAAQHD